MCVVAVRQHIDEAVGVRQLRRVVDFLVGGVQFAVADVLHDGACEQVGILKNDAEGVPEICLFDLIDVDAVVADLAVVHIVEPVDQVGDGRLARAGGTDEGHFLSRLRVEGQVVEYHVIRHIAEGHVVELHVSGQFGVSYGAVRLMWMFPCPQTGTLRTFDDVAVGILLRVDQCHVSFV